MQTDKNYRQYNMSGKNRRSLRERLASLSVFSRIFAVLSLALLVFGLCTVGAFNGTGRSVSVAPSGRDISFAYVLSYEEGQSLAAIYVNVGAVYADTGAERAKDTMQVRARYYTDSGWNGSFGSTVYIADIYAEEDSSAYKSNANYNWVALAEGRTVTSERVRINVLAAGCAGVVNEVAFVDAAGRTIAARADEAYCDGVTREEVMRTLDAQGSFSPSASYRRHFSYAEEYILQSVHGIELGGEANTENVYVISSDYNAFGILIHALSVWIFGKSTFGLRLPSLLAAFGLFVLCFLLGRRLFRSDKWGLALAALFVLGGGFFGLGLTGTPQAAGLFFAVLGIYFMYRFFSEGVGDEHPVVGALPVLFSALSSAAAFAVSPLTGLPALVSLLLFVCGLLRLYHHRAYLIGKVGRAGLSAGQAAQGGNPSVSPDAAEEKAEGKGGQTAEGAGENASDAVIARINGAYLRKLRICAGWLGCGVAFAVLLLVLAAVPVYSSFVRFYGEGSFFDMIGRGIAACFSVGDVTPFTAADAATPWGWFIALRAARLYASADGAAQAFFLPDFLAAYLAAAAFLFCSAYLLFAAPRHRGEKGYRRILRAYTGLSVGMLTGLLPWLFSASVPAERSAPFWLFYLGFIVLALCIIGAKQETAKRDGLGIKRAKAGAADVVCIVILSALFVLFVLGMPAVFGWEIGAKAAAVMFGWQPPVAWLPVV